MFRQTEMKKLLSVLTILVALSGFSLTGCSKPERKSVTDGLSKSEIDEYKANQKRREAEQMEALKDMQ